MGFSELCSSMEAGRSSKQGDRCSRGYRQREQKSVKTKKVAIGASDRLFTGNAFYSFLGSKAQPLTLKQGEVLIFNGQCTASPEHALFGTCTWTCTANITAHPLHTQRHTPHALREAQQSRPAASGQLVHGARAITKGRRCARALLQEHMHTLSHFRALFSLCIPHSVASPIRIPRAPHVQGTFSADSRRSAPSSWSSNGSARSRR